jgi:hypothetical protein
MLISFSIKINFEMAVDARVEGEIDSLPDSGLKIDSIACASAEELTPKVRV